MTNRRQLLLSQLAIARQRMALKRLRRIKVALVAGKFANEVDLGLEIDKLTEFLKEVNPDLKEVIDVLAFYADSGNYVGLTPAVIVDDGAKARTITNDLE